MLNFHGGRQVEKLVSEEKRESLLKDIEKHPALEVDEAFLCDIEMMATGALSPVGESMKKEDYQSVLSEMRLSDGVLWPFPIVVRVSAEDVERFKKVDTLRLVHKGKCYALLHVEDIYSYNREEEALRVYGTTSTEHPSVKRLVEAGSYIIAGPIDVLRRPLETLFPEHNRTPSQLHQLIIQKGWKTAVGFQTRNPIHRAHEYIQKCALEIVDGLIVNPLVGLTKKDDIPADVRMRCYEVLLENYYPEERVILSIYHGAMRYGGPREAVFHAITRKNYGCTHFIVGRDHAGVGNFYGPYDAQKIFDTIDSSELGITPLFFENSFYCRRCGGMASFKTCPHDGEGDRLVFSGTRVREMLSRGEVPPPEFSRPEVISILLEYYQSKNS